MYNYEFYGKSYFDQPFLVTMHAWGTCTNNDYSYNSYLAGLPNPLKAITSLQFHGISLIEISKVPKARALVTNRGRVWASILATSGSYFVDKVE